MARDFGRPIVRIVGHCTATTQEATVEQIQAYWRNNLGWKNPGYHYIFPANGERVILAHLSKVVNGVRGFNWNSVHFSWIGGKDGVNNMTEAQAVGIVSLVRELRSDAILGPVPVVGHRDLSPDRDGNGIITPDEWLKKCPSMDMAKFLRERGIW